MNITEIASYIGYLASVFIVLSFVFRNLMTVRLINLIGCICFVMYGFFIAKEPLYPVIIPNAILSLSKIISLPLLVSI